MTSDEYPYLAQLSVPDRLRLAAYEATDRGVPTFHLKAILDAAEELEGLIYWLEPPNVLPLNCGPSFQHAMKPRWMSGS